MGNAHPVRLLLTSDLHYRLPTFDWLAGVADQYDAVAVAGDLLNVASPVPVDCQIVVVDAYLDRIAATTTLLVASGNHDLDGPGEHGEQVAAWRRRPRQGTAITDGSIGGRRRGSIHGVPVVGRTTHPGRGRPAVARRRAHGRSTLDLALSRSPGRNPAVPGRSTIVSRS